MPKMRRASGNENNFHQSTRHDINGQLVIRQKSHPYKGLITEDRHHDGSPNAIPLHLGCTNFVPPYRSVTQSRNSPGLSEQIQGNHKVFGQRQRRCETGIDDRLDVSFNSTRSSHSKTHNGFESRIDDAQSSHGSDSTRHRGSRSHEPDLGLWCPFPKTHHGGVVVPIHFKIAGIDINSDEFTIIFRAEDGFDLSLKAFDTARGEFIKGVFPGRHDIPTAFMMIGRHSYSIFPTVSHRNHYLPALAEW